MLDDNQDIVKYEIKSKKHVLLSVGTGNIESGTIQINNSQGKAITINDDTLTFNAKGATLKASKSNVLDISNKAFVNGIDASAYKTAVTIIGNDKDNILKGGKTNETLNGGAGNDTLTGGKGNDIFVHKKGNDVITDYAAGDVISLAGGAFNDVVSWTLSKNDVIFNLGDDNTIKIKNGKNKNIKINDDTRKYNKAGSTSITVYGITQGSEDTQDDLSDALDTTQTVAASMIEDVDNMWFVDEDNFAVDELASVLPSTSIEYFNERVINLNTLNDKNMMNTICTPNKK